ncbi:protein translocase subunit SecF [Brucepastera parasyntrophica]|uniref:protein translocase subunit SecF n=1 Tax=Brucepastera parasyntrophica TaxID=2880008 RepID=UPI0021089910|nr:protein translocase subunit SecF [Brucepastera parasyntrophica]ULQ60367.1 protein translocase subunit SecF [Brucepastera parasyntrophica]
MKKVIKFSRLFLPMAILSIVLIASGIYGFFTRGINFGIDFQAGLIEQIRLAPTAFTLAYQGSQTVTYSQNATGINFVITGVGADNETIRYAFHEYPTVEAFAAAVTDIPGVSIRIEGDPSVPLRSIFPDATAITRLSATPFRLHYVPQNAEPVNADEIREALADYPDAAVQVIGDPAERTFQVRLSDDGTDSDASFNLRAGLNAALVKAYGDENLAVISADFVGSRFSGNLARQSVFLVIGALALIWLYAAIRFRWDFALGAIIAIMHDALIMVTFIIWTRMQFNSTTLAAILTIIGYSINDTVVVFDRIRENMRLYPNMSITEHLNLSQTECLGRTIITTITTMLAVVSLFIFTTGDIKDFALALLIGLISGVYSTLFIASGFINFVSRFRKDKGIIHEKAKSKPAVSGEMV